MTDDELNAIEARCNAATPGPWSLTTHTPGWGYHRAVTPASQSERQAFADALFIQAARQQVPTLIAEIRWLRAVLQRHRGDDMNWACVECNVPLPVGLYDGAPEPTHGATCEIATLLSLPKAAK